ncbi:GNAT family N-acyltransferase [Salinispirillum marinum]|uniref:L-ornithine N(alpha)-acyltransferase n=2 Tax=Saccharospirillaceae TaxID=255527 RepID=A0ABV8BI97_9GAMM
MTLAHQSTLAQADPIAISAVIKNSVAQELAALAPLAQFRGLNIYSFTGDECPAAMEEIGRLREAGFRAVGAGRGEELDLDHRDYGEQCYSQLVAWDPEYQEMVAMYRYQLGAKVAVFGPECLRTFGLFDYSLSFQRNILPYAIELGRSVVNRAAKKGALGFFATWVGLGALLRKHPEVQYFFGNVSLYQTLNYTGRDLLVSTMQAHYAPPEPYLVARQTCRYEPTHAAAAFGENNSADERIRQLRDALLPHDMSIPPVLQSYMSLSTGIWCGETVFDADFGNALELGIIVPVAEINAKVKARFIDVQ